MSVNTHIKALLITTVASVLAGGKVQARLAPPPGAPPGTAGLTPLPPPQVALDAARATWDMQNTGFYDFQYTKSTMMSWMEGYPWTVKVRRGRIRDVLFSNGTAVPLAPPDLPPTITDLLDTIQDAINQPADSVDVTYSSKYGYPTNINIDYRQEIGDDELYVTVVNYIEQPAYETEIVQAALTSAQNLWSSYAIEMYSFSYDESCLVCSSYHYPWTIQVLHFQRRAIDSLGNAILDSRTLSDIPHLFDVLQNALNNRAHDIQVTYHPDLGFPTSINIKYDPQVPDDQLALSISEMNILGNPRAEMLLAQRHWSHREFSMYVYTYQEHRNGAGNSMAYPWVVEVQNNEIMKITDNNGDIVITIATLPSIDNVFTTIEEALDRNAATVNVIYSEEYGYPEHVFIDQDTRPGDERTIEISNFIIALP